jgi:flagellar motility protein MotE (MotC chaperone)
MRLFRPRLLPPTIMVMSALLLLKTVTMVQAAAEQVTPPAPIAGQAASAANAPPAQPAPVRVSDSPPISEAERAVLLDLRQRREALDARARALDQRAAELQAADRRLNDRIQQLSGLQGRLESLETVRQQHKAENWAGLVKVYEAMKPRDAAAIFDALDMQVLLQVLDRMQERKAAPVLAAMQPDRARLATQLLAEMRTRATTPPPPDPKG